MSVTYDNGDTDAMDLTYRMIRECNSQILFCSRCVALERTESQHTVRAYSRLIHHIRKRLSVAHPSPRLLGERNQGGPQCCCFGLEDSPRIFLWFGSLLMNVQLNRPRIFKYLLLEFKHLILDPGLSGAFLETKIISEPVWSISLRALSGRIG